MTFVFVSHAGNDKERLKPLLEELLAAGIPLWIDRPSELGLETHRLVEAGIRPGKVWDDEIDDALNRSACVLFFLSRSSYSPERSDSLFRELDHAILGDKLVVAQIDDIDKRKLPGLLRIRQAVDIADDLRLGLQEGGSNNFKHLVRTVREHVSPRVNPDKNMASSERLVAFERRFRTLLPYMCNRRDQKQLFVRRLQLELDHPSDAPLFFIVSGRDNQCADKFVEQLHIVDLPKLLQANGRISLAHQCPVRWPVEISSAKGADDPNGDLEGLKFDIRERLALKQTSDDSVIQGWLDNQPGVLFVHFDIDVHRWTSDHRSLIGELMKWWTKFNLAERRFPVVLIGQLTASPGIIKEVTRGLRTKATKKEIARARPADYPVENLIMLPDLGNVTLEDVDFWLNEHSSLAIYDQERLGKSVRGFFSGIRASGLLGTQSGGVSMFDAAGFLDQLLEEHDVQLESERVGEMLA